MILTKEEHRLKENFPELNQEMYNEDGLRIINDTYEKLEKRLEEAEKILVNVYRSNLPYLQSCVGEYFSKKKNNG